MQILSDNNGKNNYWLEKSFQHKENEHTMMYYVKQSLFAFVYLLFMMIIAFGILCIGIPWLEITLCILNIGFYIGIMAVTFYKEGESSMKVLHANDIEREQIIKTGEDRPLKIHEEYKAWKGYVIGLIICIPLILCLIIHTVITIVSNGTMLGGGAVAGFIYLAFYAPISVIIGEANFWGYYILLYAVPLISVTSGLFYNMGAKKIQRQYERIAEKQRQIYGGKS